MNKSKDYTLYNYTQFDIFFNRKNDIPWAIRIIGQKEWILVNKIDFYKVSVITMYRPKGKQPRAFLRGIGAIIVYKKGLKAYITS